MSALIIFIPSCWQPAPLPPSAPNPVISAPPLPTPQPQFSLSPAPSLSIQRLIASSYLRMRVGEELMLVGQVEMNNGERFDFDTVHTQLKIENRTPSLLRLDPVQRMITALQAGIAEIHLFSVSNPQVNITIQVFIENPPPSIDPNLALVELEIE